MKKNKLVNVKKSISSLENQIKTKKENELTIKTNVKANQNHKKALVKL